jgi:hypothetical protein
VVTRGDAVPAREVVVCTLAMFVMWEMEPRKFRSDDGFRTQLARRVRRFTEANAAHYFDATANKGKRVYRDVAPRGSQGVRWLAGGDAGRTRGYYRFSRVGRSPVSFPRRPPTWGFFGPYPMLQSGSEVGLGSPPQCEADRPKSIKLGFADLSPLRDTAVAPDQCGFVGTRQATHDESAFLVSIVDDLGEREGTLGEGPCLWRPGHYVRRRRGPSILRCASLHTHRASGQPHGNPGRP